MTESRTMLITGATSGIGEATARMAVEAGYRVALAARSADKLERLVRELGGADKAIGIGCDVTEYEDQQVGEKTALFSRGAGPGNFTVPVHFLLL